MPPPDSQSAPTEIVRGFPAGSYLPADFLPLPEPFLRGEAPNPIQTKELLSRANLAYWRGDKVGASICMFLLTSRARTP